jgi:hypothetical protein
MGLDTKTYRQSQYDFDFDKNISVGKVLPFREDLSPAAEE